MSKCKKNTKKITIKIIFPKTLKKLQAEGAGFEPASPFGRTLSKRVE